MRIDFHSHILPEIDDGSGSPAESEEMLNRLAGDGVDKVILTPHFYRNNETIASFLKRRASSYEKLGEITAHVRGCPELVLGAEVLFYPSLCRDELFNSLCIENTGYVLLELPFQKFTTKFYNDFSSFMNECSCKIILAHIERYLGFGNKPTDIMKLLDYGSVLFQMNCSSLAEAGLVRRHKLTPMINGHIISAIGTDAHNMRSRAPEYAGAEKVIIQHCGQNYFDEICLRSEMILNDRPIADIIE